MSKYWIVISDETAKMYGPFTNSQRASKWATKNIRGHWYLVRLRNPK